MALLANEQLEQRLLDDPEGTSARDLAIIGGIATDKVTKMEQKEAEKTLLGALTELADAVRGRVEFDIHPVIDAQIEAEDPNDDPTHLEIQE